MPEVFGQDFFSKRDDVDDCKPYIVFVPADNLLVLGVLA